jgi:Spy/CpxP family protein refolding chaperone
MRSFAIILLAALALACGACHRHGGWASKDPVERANWALKKLAKKLDLDAEQKAKALPILVAMATQREEWRGEGAKAVEELRTQAEAESFDKAALNKAYGIREAKWAQSRLLFVEHLAELHALLKPAQRQKAAEILAKLEKHLQN